VEHGGVASVSVDVEDFGLAGNTGLGITDAIGFSWVVGSKFVAAEDEFDVGGLVQTFGFAGCDAGDDSFYRYGNVGAENVAAGWVVGAGRGAFDTRDVLAPVRKD
jgi:hypothetical protein